MHEIDYTFLFLSFPQSNLEGGGGGGGGVALHCLGLNHIYKYTCQRDICFLLSKVNNQLHLIY